MDTIKNLYNAFISAHASNIRNYDNTNYILANVKLDHAKVWYTLDDIKAHIEKNNIKIADEVMALVTDETINDLVWSGYGFVSHECDYLNDYYKGNCTDFEPFATVHQSIDLEQVGYQHGRSGGWYSIARLDDIDPDNYDDEEHQTKEDIQEYQELLNALSESIESIEKHANSLDAMEDIIDRLQNATVEQVATLYV